MFRHGWKRQENLASEFNNEKRMVSNGALSQSRSPNIVATRFRKYPKHQNLKFNPNKRISQIPILSNCDPDVNRATCHHDPDKARCRQTDPTTTPEYMPQKIGLFEVWARLLACGSAVVAQVVARVARSRTVQFLCTQTGTAFAFSGLLDSCAHTPG